MEDKATATRGTLGPVTRKQAMYLLTTIWPDVPEHEIVKAAMLCQQYNLNPLMKQIYIIPFAKKGGGSTYATVLGIGASRAIAQSKGFKYSYEDGPRVMTEAEQVEILGEVEADKIWALTKVKDADGNVFPGYGFWPKDTDVYGHDKGNTKRNMAFIRSERNALDRMAPGTLPDVEIMDEEYSPVKDVPKAIAEGKQEFEGKVEEDIDDFWPGKVAKVADIDMVWLKDSLAEVRDRKPLVYKELGKWLEKALEGKQPQSWSGAVAELNREQAGAFVELVQRALEL